MAAEIVSIFDVGDYEQQVRKAADALKGGGIVVLPTETVYGAAAVLNNAPALAKLRALSPAASGKPLVIHLHRHEDAERYLGPVSDLGRRMMRKLWPGPVSLVFDVPKARQKEVARKLELNVNELYDQDTITLRCPDHIVAIDVLGAVSEPVVMRKASDQRENLAAIAAEWGESLEMVLDAGPTRYSKPSTMIRVKESTYEIIRPGVYDQRIIERLLKTTILFVCSGNTCRSPMAEALARQAIARRMNVSEVELEGKGVTVLSAGSFAMPGARAAGPAVEALKPLGADLSRHRSRPLSVELIHQADVIYVMSRAHGQAVSALVPSAKDKVQTLDPKGDIEDPIGGDIALYQTLATQLQKLIDKRLEERPVAL